MCGYGALVATTWIGTWLANAHMMHVRRVFLLGSCLGIASTAAHTRADTEVEAVGYGGTSPGAWACGPLGRANYGGVGARVRVSEQDADGQRHGFTGEIAAGAEYEKVVIQSCEGDEDCEAGEPGPEARVLGGAHARVGYQFRGASIEGGMSAFQGWKRYEDSEPSLALFPDLEASVGRAERGRAFAGIGTPLVTQYRRPGAYGGCEFPISSTTLRLQGGAFRAGPQVGNIAARVDGVVLLAVGDATSVRLGGGGSFESEEGVGAEGSVGLRIVR